MGMKRKTGTWPGTQEGVVETITINPKVSWYRGAIHFSILSCCPRSMYVNWTAEVGGNIDVGNDSFGSNTAHYATGINTIGDSSASNKRATTQIDIKQRWEGCAGESFDLKICITLTDNTSCSGSAIFDKTCPSSTSYVDVT